MGFNFYQSGLGDICKDCQERYLACHDSCEKYTKARAEWVEKKQMITDAKRKTRLYDKYRVEQSIKGRKRKNNGNNH